MSRKNLIIFLIAILVLVGACGLPTGPIKKVQQNSNPQGSTSQPETAIQPPLSGGNGQSGSQADIQKSFPVAPNSQMTSPDSGEPNDPSGSFTIQSQSTIDAVVKYYADELPKQGWTLRFTDANFSGGVTQYWKKDNIYLFVNIGFTEGQLTIHCQYDRVESQAAQKLPKDFPVPAQAEIVKAEATSWEYYIPQDYAAVTSFYTQKLSSMNWKLAPPSGSMDGECGGNDCGSGSTFPAGAMPTATIDPRQSNRLSFTMPDGNVIDLTITPHQNGTILYVDLTLKNVESAGLPQDVPIYPGATVQMIAPGMAEFQVNADMNTVESYYNEHLKAAGWTLDGNPIESAGSYLENWKKDAQKISIILVPSGAKINLVINCSSCMQ